MVHDMRLAPLVIGLVLLVMGLTAWSEAMAQEPVRQRSEAAPLAPSEPQEEASPRIPVNVEHAGSDPVGIRLAFALKETFGKSPLFHITGGEAKKIILYITTKAEFADRPGLASGWSAVWLFTERSDVLSFYLESDLGFAVRDDTEDTAVALASRTEEIARRFAYLFE